jgi:hypothetical protein
MQHTRKLLFLPILLILLALPMLATQAQQGTATPAPTLAPATPAPTEAPVTVIPGGTEVDTAINVGDTVEGELNDDALVAHYTFTGQEGDVVSISLVSDDFDSYLVLLDDSGTILDENDDGAGSLNSLINGFVLPADGEYTIEATSFSRFSTGSYTLTVSEGSTGPVVSGDTVAQDSGEISIGDAVTGSLNTSTVTTRYTFEAEAGQVVTISLTSEDFDTYVRLLDPSGSELAYDDDSGGNLDSRIGPFTLPSNGTYTISVESFGGSATGSYNLSLSASQLQLMEYSQVIQGALTFESPSALYSFRGQAGDVITVNMTSSDFDSYLTLAEGNSAGFPLISDDDGGGNLNSLIGPYTLPSTGNYLITVSSLSGSDIGNYTVSLNRVTLDTIQVGETVEAQIVENGGALYYSFEGTMGSVVNITVDSGGSLDTTLIVRSPDGYQAGYDDDSGANFDPEISRLALSQTGTYILVVQPYTPGSSGEVTISLGQSELRTLDDGAQQVSLNDKQFEEYFSFSSVAGEHVQIIVRVQGGGTASPNVIVTESGTQIAAANGTNVSELVFDFVTPQDCQPLVQIYDYSYASVILEVELVRLGVEESGQNAKPMYNPATGKFMASCG